MSSSATTPTTPFFDHPGDVQSFAAGDFGYGPAYPTDLQFVTSVGGTSLKHSGNKRGWTESAWGNSGGEDGTGGGCSAFEAKPSWQRADASYPGGCLNRTENDVSADADPDTGALVFDSFKQSPPGFEEIGGTSEATPIITAIYALAGTPTKGTFPGEYPYLHTKNLFDVTSGVNGTCEANRQYLCHGKNGFDGPTGLGTPNGTAAFANGTTHRVTVVDPGVQDVAVSTKFSLLITGLDTRKVSSLKWTASGLPTGLSISAVSKSTNAKITGTLPAAPGTFNVTVTAKDGSTVGTTHFTIVVLPSLSFSNPPSGKMNLAAKASLCLDGGTDASGQMVKVQTCSNASAASQDWQYVATSQPGDIGTLQIAGECATTASTKAPQKISLSPCTGGGTQQWIYLGFGAVWSPFTGSCLNAASLSAGSAVTGTNCTFSKNQTWNLPAGPVTVDGSSLCLDNPTGSTVKVDNCNLPSQTSELWTFEGSGQIENNSGECLASTSFQAQTALTVEACDPDNGFQFWLPGPSGELQNDAVNGAQTAFNMCLADPGNGGNGTTADQDQCYGYEGEIWGLN